jgi:hypothetical protein
MNPYEIRLELLKMAKEMMDKQYTDSTNAYWAVIENMADRTNKSVSEIIKICEDTKPEMYSPADMMKKAQELYSFVSKKE